MTSAVEGTIYPFVLNNNGAVTKGHVMIVPTQPDIFAIDHVGPGGRADIKNVTNRVHLTEPFTVTSIKVRGGTRVPTVFRLKVTGVRNAVSSVLSFRIGSVTVPAGNVLSDPVEVEPGIFTIDFTVPDTLDAAGDVPIILDVNAGGTIFSSRMPDTSTYMFFL